MCDTTLSNDTDLDVLPHNRPSIEILVAFLIEGRGRQPDLSVHDVLKRGVLTKPRIEHVGRIGGTATLAHCHVGEIEPARKPWRFHDIWRRQYGLMIVVVTSEVEFHDFDESPGSQHSRNLVYKGTVVADLIAQKKKSVSRSAESIGREHPGDIIPRGRHDLRLKRPAGYGRRQSHHRSAACLD